MWVSFGLLQCKCRTALGEFVDRAGIGGEGSRPKRHHHLVAEVLGFFVLG